MIALLQGILERGLIFALVVAGVYIASRIINFDNLAVEGAFGLGGALSAQAIVYGFNPLYGFLGAVCIGIVSGLATGLLYTKLRLNNLISGIVLTTASFSFVLKIAGANVPLYGKPTIFSSFADSSYGVLMILIVFVGLVFLLVKWLLQTQVGFLLQAVGDNPQMLLNVGKSVDGYIILGLIISNTLAALSGALFVQYLGYFSIWASMGVLILGIAALIVAEAFSKQFGFVLILGSIIYQALIAATFELNIDQDWNKLVTAVLIVILIMLKNNMRTQQG
jgi:putative ABC transport system permease protein